MPNTYIDTNALPRTSVPGAGEFTEVLNDRLCGAKNVLGALRWLGAGDRYQAGPHPGAHQLIYVMEGEATITLDGRDHRVGKGAGLYLGPSESATVAQAGAATLKLFHLTVPRQS